MIHSPTLALATAADSARPAARAQAHPFLAFASVWSVLRDELERPDVEPRPRGSALLRLLLDAFSPSALVSSLPVLCRLALPETSMRIQGGGRHGAARLLITAREAEIDGAGRAVAGLCVPLLALFGADAVTVRVLQRESAGEATALLLEVRWHEPESARARRDAWFRRAEPRAAMLAPVLDAVETAVPS